MCMRERNREGERQTERMSEQESAYVYEDRKRRQTARNIQTDRQTDYIPLQLCLQRV